MAETTFSSLKRMFREHVSARKTENMVRELTLKASLYNLLIALTPTHRTGKNRRNLKEPLKPKEKQVIQHSR